MTSLWTSDNHLDTNPRNAYRWEILPWLEREATAHEVDFIGVNGDFTDAKDCHPSKLVNRISDFIIGSRHQWVFNTGNHDYADPNNPFFRFLGEFEHVRWVYKPTILDLPVASTMVKTLILPATKNWEEEWGVYHRNANEVFPYIFVHATFAGTLSENGFKLDGVDPDFFLRKKNGFGRLFAGDIHTPGLIGDSKIMEYIGCPYRINFGDTFNPRVLHFGKRDIKTIRPPMRSRHVLEVRSVAEFDDFDGVHPEDQVKLRVRLARNELAEWRTIRKEFETEAQKRGWEVCGIKPYRVAPVKRQLDTVTTDRQGYQTPDDRVREFGKAMHYKVGMIKTGLSYLPSGN